MNLADGVYASWFVMLSIALALESKSSVSLALNLGFLVVIVLTSNMAHKSSKWRIAHDWYPILLFIVVFEQVARLSLIFVPHWQDAGILRFEAAIFPQPPTEWLAQFTHPAIAELLEFGYFRFYWMLPLAGIVLYGRGWEKREEELRGFRLWMNALAIGYVTCFTIYLLFPTEGPAHTIARHGTVATGPFRWLVLLIQGEGGVHGNAFPSVHIMAATVSVLAAIRWVPRFGWWLVPPLILMCFGAVFDSYHYASDIVAGAVLGALSFAFARYLLEPRAHGVN